MSDKIKKILETPEVPEELRPENIPALIDSRGGKRKNIKRTVFRTAAAAAACTLICAGSVQMMKNQQKSSHMNFSAPAENSIAFDNGQMKSESAAAENAEAEEAPAVKNTAFVKLGSYEEMHVHLTDSLRNSMYYLDDGAVIGEEEIDADYTAKGETGMDMVNDAPAYESDFSGEDEQSDIYETLSQVEGIAEADIIKASANAVYYLTYDGLRYVPFDSKTGKFGDSRIIDLRQAAGLNDNYSSEIRDMYLDGDRLAVVSFINNYAESVSATGVFVFDVSDDVPEFIQSSYQTGYYSSSRMKDGIMYLITTQGADYRLADDESDYKKYIPCTGISPEKMECLPCDSIYVPREWNEKTPFSYTNISAVDIRDSASAVNSVSVSGWTGDIYCSEKNLYTVGYNYFDETPGTLITRFTLENNSMEPVASGTAEGCVLNQFSMDEYRDFFRIATTSYKPESYETVNNVFVFDMDMNIVGSVTGFAETESVKSVSFNGDTGYVVTYEQTDPLFAVDLSDPYNPVITDEFRISGYSSFLRKWNDDLLFGFGVDTDDSGEIPIETGVKLVMFDVSDDGNLNECGLTAISGKHYHEIFSDAVYDRKALLYSHQRNLIGFPLYDQSSEYRYYEINDDIYYDDIEDVMYGKDTKPLPVISYRIYSYENGEFVEKASVAASDYRYEWKFRRGIYIGNYMCIFSDSECVSVDLKDFKETDRLIF